MNNIIVSQDQKSSLLAKVAKRYSVEPNKLMDTLKATAFKVRDGNVSNEQMMALLIVADQYGLNPFTKEIYAFPDKQNGIVPVVGVDGWSRIINDHPQSDGFEFRQSEKTVVPQDGKECPEWMEVIFYRKDRAHPIVVREFIDEVYQSKRGQFNGPWQTHTKRFLRHKTLIQGARIAFGFSGIYDEDEAQRITERDITESSYINQRIDMAIYPQDLFDKNLSTWSKLISDGKKTPDEIIYTVQSKFLLTEDQKSAIRMAEQQIYTLESNETDKKPTFSMIESLLRNASVVDQLDIAADLIGNLTCDLIQKNELTQLYLARKEEL